MITNGYATLAELKERLMETRRYTAATISFDTSTDTIADTAKGLARFLSGKRILISGSASNNGYFNIVTGGNAASFTVSENLVNEVAGATVLISDVTDPMDDNALENVIEAISRVIDEETGRFFYVTASQDRYYTAEFSDLLMDIDDIVTASAIVTDEDGDRTYERTWASTDYDLEPYNAALHSKPYTRINLAPQGRYAFPSGIRRGVKITGTFGYPAVPKQINEATILIAMKLWKRKEAVFGVLGSADMGFIRVTAKNDPDISMLLDSFRKTSIGGV